MANPTLPLPPHLLSEFDSVVLRMFESVDDANSRFESTRLAEAELGLVNQITELKRQHAHRRNSCQPLCRIPPETLTKSLSFLSAKDQLSMIRVCQSLRQHVVDTPGLWTQVDHIKNPAALSFVLERGGNSPVDSIRLCVAGLDDFLFETLAVHMHRIRDESKPACKRCTASGFVCNYARGAPALQLARGAGGTGTLKLTLDLPAPLPGLRIPVAGPVAGGPEGSYEMRASDFAALERFRTRTVLTVGSAGTRHLYKEGAFELGVTNPFLLHVFLALSLLHDTHLASSTTSAAHRSSLAFHWYHGTALFHRNLASASQSSSPHTLPGPYRDALWASAAILGAAAFVFVGPADPAVAWPLKAPAATDLDWLKMSDGKKVVWDITDPTRPDSVFNPLLADHARHVAPDGLAPISPTALPAPFYPLFDLAESTPCTNPYHIAASLIAQLLHREINDNNVIQFLSFLSQLDPRFRRLLEEKEPRAMLLLSYWYAKVASFNAWWLNRRAQVEGQAICIYLERECADDQMIMELLEFPKAMLFKGKFGYDRPVGRVLGVTDGNTLRAGGKV